jgi:hypothetical protein
MDHGAEAQGVAAVSTWRLIKTAPQDGMVILAANNRKQMGIVFLNVQGEWELVNIDRHPTGTGFYPTHWMHLPEYPK